MAETTDQKVEEKPSRKRPPRSLESIEKQRETRRVNDEAKRAVRAAALAREAEQRKSEEYPQAEIPEEEAVVAGVEEPDAAIPSAVSPRTGLSADEQTVIDLTRKLAEAKAKIKSAGISDSQRLMIEKIVKVDVFNTHRYYVELTPSMCEVRNCGYDAATDPEVGCAGWDAAPINQVVNDGKTFGQRLIELKEYHKATAHTNQSLNDHIITAEELHKRQWGIGQDVRADFLTGPK